MAKPKDKKSIIQDITNRYRVTAREARDIVTAIGTYVDAPNIKTAKAAKTNIVKQVKETGSALKSGKKGTSSDLIKGDRANKKEQYYRKGTERK